MMGKQTVSRFVVSGSAFLSCFTVFTDVFRSASCFWRSFAVQMGHSETLVFVWYKPSRSIWTRVAAFFHRFDPCYELILPACFAPPVCGPHAAWTALELSYVGLGLSQVRWRCRTKTSRTRKATPNDPFWGFALRSVVRRKSLFRWGEK